MNLPPREGYYLLNLNDIINGVIVTLIVNFLLFLLHLIFKFLFNPLLREKKKDNFLGLYECTYTTWKKKDGSRGVTKELIYMCKISKEYKGFLLWRNYNGEEMKEIKKPIFRLEGQKLQDNSLYIGTWHDPREDNNRAGGFTLLYDVSGNNYNGLWSGWDKERKSINRGQWEWKRSNIKLSFFKFFIMRLSKKYYKYFYEKNNLENRKTS